MKETLIAEKITVSPELIKGDIKDYFVLKVSGDMYHPAYMNGDTVLFCRNLSKLNPGNVYAVLINGSVELRRYEVCGEEGKVCLCGLSMNEPPIFLSPSEYKVIGFPVLLTREIH